MKPMQEIKFIQSTECLSIDLDSTLLQSQGRLSEVALKLIRLAHRYNIPCFITTSRCIYSLTQDLIKDLQSGRDLKEIRKIMKYHCFTNLFSELKKEQIAIPIISTAYDPCLKDQSQQGLYWREIEKMTQLYLKQIDRVEKGEIAKEFLIEQINKIKSLLLNGNDSKSETDFKLDSQDDQEILSLALKENELRLSHFSKIGEVLKYHQFLWIQSKIKSCKTIIHLDDYDKVFTPFGIKNADDVCLSSRFIYYESHGKWLKTINNPSDGVTVYCIPFKESNSEKIYATTIRGMDLNLDAIIDELKYFTNCCSSLHCFFSKTTIKRIQTANYTKSILVGLRIASVTKEIPNDDKGMEPSGHSFLPQFAFSEDLALILEKIPFDRLTPLPMGSNLCAVQEGLERFQQSSSSLCCNLGFS
jgi:hypothetical protein